MDKRFWKTEAAFWSWLRGGLRRGLWNKSPIKLQYIQDHRVRISGKKEGTTRWGGKCEQCNNLFPQNQLQVDHVHGNMPLRNWRDVLAFVQHLATPEGLQLLCTGCHKIKSYSESKGISFEDAKIEKEVIQICKNTKSAVEFLEKKGYTSSSAPNASKRRELIRKILKEEYSVKNT